MNTPNNGPEIPGQTLHGGEGVDTFAAGDGQDTIADFGDGDTLEIAGVPGGFAALVIEQDGGDAVVRYGDRGGKGYDHLHGSEGDDILYGDAGSDWLHGGNNSNQGNYGDDGNDTLHGGAGDDILIGGNWRKGSDEGDDTLWGGRGADRFVFDRESETDTIHDFEDGKDVLVIKGGLKLSDLDIKQSGDDAVVSGPSDAFSIIIKDFDASLLTADDFDFIA